MIEIGFMVKRSSDVLEVVPDMSGGLQDILKALAECSIDVELTGIIPGIYQSEVFIGSTWEIPREHMNIYCLTAIDQTGKVLWQRGTPWMKWPHYDCHAAQFMVCFDAKLGKIALTLCKCWDRGVYRIRNKVVKPFVAAGKAYGLLRRQSL
jgi:hypothetical protein